MRRLLLIGSLVLTGCLGEVDEGDAAGIAADDGGASSDAHATDTGATDAAAKDSGTTDADPSDASDASEDAGPADSGPADTGAPDTAPADPLAKLCDGVASAPFDPPNVCDGPGGNTSKELPSNGVYSTSWFGCYRKADGTIYKDPYDNCEFACGSKGLCASGLSGPECEAQLKWFAADADRYGCGARIRVTNCANGKQVVLATLDRGPNCNSVEKKYGAPVLDMSHPAMVYLFDGKTYGGSDKKRVVVEKVDGATPLGPVE